MNDGTKIEWLAYRIREEIILEINSRKGFDFDILDNWIRDELENEVEEIIIRNVLDYEQTK